MDQRQLLAELTSLFDEPAIREIALSLGVAYDQLPGPTAAKAQALVAQLADNGRLPALAQAMIGRRPELADQYEAGDPLGWLEQMAGYGADRKSVV